MKYFLSGDWTWFFHLTFLPLDVEIYNGNARRAEYFTTEIRKKSDMKLRQSIISNSLLNIWSTCRKVHAKSFSKSHQCAIEMHWCKLQIINLMLHLTWNVSDQIAASLTTAFNYKSWMTGLGNYKLSENWLIFDDDAD